MDKTDQMFPLVDQYRSSGLSMKDFSAQNHIKLTTLRYWVKKKKQSEAKAVTGNFLPLNFDPPRVKTGQIEILYPNGVKILLTNPDKEELRDYINLFGC